MYNVSPKALTVGPRTYKDRLLCKGGWVKEYYIKEYILQEYFKLM